MEFKKISNLLLMRLILGGAFLGLALSGIFFPSAHLWVDVAGASCGGASVLCLKALHFL
jgi:hypothetical protein